MLNSNLPFILNWPCVCFFRQQLQSYCRPHHFYSLCCFSYSPRKRSKKPLLPNWPIKKVWKRVITHMALLPWTKPHGAFQFCFYRKNFFFFLLSRLLEVTTSWHQFRLAVWHCSFGLLLSFSLPIPTKEIYSFRYIDISWMSSIYILWYFHLYGWD